MAYRRYRKYASSTSPSRQIQYEDPQPRRENNDVSFLIDALTHRILDSGLLDDKFFKNFFLTKDDQKKDNTEQRNIVEKKLSQALRLSRKVQNQGIIRVIEEYAKEKGIPFSEQIKYQQYDILEKPLILQPTILVTRDREWQDIFEKFKSENLKIDLNQNQQEFKRIINNNLSTYQKLVLILRQRFVIHDAQSFPNENPQVGNQEKDGNIIFMIDDNQIPHRILFRNRDDYDLIEWFIQRRTQQKINVVKVDWIQYIKNVKKIRGDQVQEKRKMIKLKGQQQMQLEQLDQSQVEIIQDVKPEYKNIQQTVKEQEQQMIFQQIQQQGGPAQQQKKPLKLVLKNKQRTMEEQQLQEELNLQKKMEMQSYIDDQMLEDLQEILAFDFDQGKQIQQVNQLDINNEDYIRILPQLPREAKPQKLQKLSRSRKLNEELDKGFIYLNQEQLTRLDAEIGQYLIGIQYKERQIQLNNTTYTITSPMSILDNPYPLNLTRQWWYFKEKAHVRFYIMHSQLLWYLYSQFQMKSQQARIFLDQIISIQIQEYFNRWSGLIIDDGQSNWFETTEGSLIKAARTNMTEQIKQNVDQEESNYVFGIQENMWFTNSQVCCLYYEHRLYGVRKTLTIYVRIQGLCYYTTMKIEEILQQMFMCGISIKNSPSFDVVQSHEIICWLCGKVSPAWESFYVHECKQSQKLKSLKEDLQSWNL